MTTEQVIEYGIDVVPILIVVYENQYSKQKTKTIYKTNEVFEWVEQIIIQRREAMKNSSDNIRQDIIDENKKNKKKDHLYDLNQLETSGVSDIYSYWHKELEQDTGIAQPKNFLPYGKDEDYNIETYNEYDKKNPHKYKLNINETKTLLSQLENTRKNQYEDIVKNNEVRQIMAAKKKLAII